MKFSKDIEKTIDQLSKGSSLNTKDEENFKRELESHFYEKMKDLEILSKQEAISKLAVKDFGNIQDISQDMFFSNYPYLKVPLIGNLLYFPLIRISIALLMSFIISFLLLIILIFPLGMVLSTKFNINLFMGVYLLPFVIAFCIGILALIKRVRFKKLILGIFMAISITATFTFLIVLIPAVSNSFASNDEGGFYYLSIVVSIVAIQLLWSFFVILGWSSAIVFVVIKNKYKLLKISK